MKKFLAILVALCLVGVGAYTYATTKNASTSGVTAAVSDSAAGNEAASSESEDAASESEDTGSESGLTSTDADAVSEAVDESTGYIDYEALYNAFEPDMVAVTVNGRELTWEDVFPWISYYTSNVEYYMQYYAMYGFTLSWTDIADEDTGMTYAEIAVNSALQYINQIYTVLDYAEENGYMTEELLAQADADIEEEIVECLGEDATMEDFEDYLHDNYSNYEQCRNIELFNLITDAVYTDKYGENAELVSDEDALAYLEDNNYIMANHILFMSTDSETGEDLTEEEIAEKLATAEEIAAELQAIEDSEERTARFLELKEEYDEDTGKTNYPNGYIFTSGDMVESFEEAAFAAEEYEVTAPVESDYGYHVIIRMPLDPDELITSVGSTAREMVANAQYNELFDSIFATGDAAATSLLDGFDIRDYLA